MIPEIPTIAESLPGYDARPGADPRARRTPKEDRREAQRLDQRGAQDGDVRAKLEGAGSRSRGTPEQFGNVIKARVEKWGRVVKAAGIKAD
jgi:tripartite-type tricarboxylate transporter receptor subunit TctC